MTKLRFLVNDLLLKYEGGEPYFDKFDEELRNPENFDIILELFKPLNNSNVIMSGKFGKYILYLHDKGLIPLNSVIVVNGGLRKFEITDFDFRFFIPNSPYIFVDDSFYLGRTRDKVSMFLKNKGCYLSETKVIYDGSLIKNNNVNSLFRYHV